MNFFPSISPTSTEGENVSNPVDIGHIDVEPVDADDDIDSFDEDFTSNPLSDDEDEDSAGFEDENEILEDENEILEDDFSVRGSPTNSNVEPSDNFLTEDQSSSLMSELRHWAIKYKIC